MSHFGDMHEGLHQAVNLNTGKQEDCLQVNMIRIFTLGYIKQATLILVNRRTVYR